MIGASPTGTQIVVGIVFVLAGCVGSAVSVELARRTHNWLYIVSSLGCAALVVGVVGQRSPSLDAAGQRQVQGPWDAAVGIPLVHLDVTPVALGGVLVALVGFALVLFFEPVPDEAARRLEPDRRRLQDDDSI